MGSERIADFWTGLPAEARQLLVQGSTGRDQLSGLARLLPLLAMRAEPARRGALLALALEFACAAWADSPLDGTLGQLAADIAHQNRQARQTLPEPVSAMLKAQANFWRPAPDDDPLWAVPAFRADRRAALLERLDAEPKNLFWKLAAWDHAWPRCDWELADAVLAEDSWPRTLFALRQRFAAQVHLCRGDAHLALASLNAASPLALLGGEASLRATALLRMDRRDEAMDVLRRSMAASPWRVSDLLRLADLASGADRLASPVPGSVAILLYTFNKARELDETLASLAASDIGGASVFVVDNGCADATGQVLAQWQERLGGRLQVVRLPVNIGAPAARNWLLSLPEVRGHDYLAFLDDDVSLPADWLPRLGAAVAACPQASVWGCRVVDEGCPLVVQNVDYAPLAPRPGEQLLVLPTLHLGAPDLGQFAYLRPCVSVTGCCHLLRSADIDRVGGFDIRFAPSQYDDLERDLRVCLTGGHAAYQGHLAVRHKRSSGQVAERTAAEIGNAAANAHKLQTKYAPEAFQRIHEAGADLLEQDLLRKMESLQL